MSLAEFHVTPQFFNEFSLRSSRKLHSEKALVVRLTCIPSERAANGCGHKVAKGSAPKLREGVRARSRAS